MLTKSAERQTFAGLLLVDPMDIIRVARIYRDRKTGMPQRLRRESDSVEKPLRLREIIVLES